MDYRSHHGNAAGLAAVFVRHLQRVIAVAAVCPVFAVGVSAREPFRDHGGPELAVPGPVLTPIQHQPMFVDERQQFGYHPRYPAGPGSFDRDNRPYIWDGTDLITLRDDGRWVGLNLERTVKHKYDWFTGNVGATDPHLSFDDRQGTWLVARLTFVKHNHPPDLRQDAFGVLHSIDDGRSWTFYETLRSPPSPHKYYLGPERIERWQTHNAFVGPPPMVEARGRALVLTVGKQVGVEDRSDDSPRRRQPPSYQFTRVVVADAQKPVSTKGRNWLTPLHSGAGNVSASRGNKTHIVWQSIQPHEWHRAALDKRPAQMQGPYTPYALRYEDQLSALAPHYIRTYDHTTAELGPPVLLGFSRRDNHDAPVISIDSKGYLHVVIGAHHDNFQYTRSIQPNRSTGGWTDPRMFGTPRPPPAEKPTAAYTYTALLIDARDTLHLVSRWAGSGYYFRLCYNRKKTGQPWEANQILIHPFRYGYCTWRHKLNTDRLGRLFLNYVQYPAQLTEQELAAYHRRWPEHQGQIHAVGPCMLISDNGGDQWRLATTEDFVRGIADWQKETHD